MQWISGSRGKRGCTTTYVRMAKQLERKWANWQKSDLTRIKGWFSRLLLIPVYDRVITIKCSCSRQPTTTKKENTRFDRHEEKSVKKLMSSLLGRKKKLRHSVRCVCVVQGRKNVTSQFFFFSFSSSSSCPPSSPTTKHVISERSRHVISIVRSESRRLSDWRSYG